MFMMHNHQWRLVLSVCSQLFIRLFFDERVEEGGRKGIEATVSLDSLNIVINMSINHSRLGVVERTRILVGIIWKEVDGEDGQ